MRDLATQLRMRRAELNIPQAKLAKAAGISVTHLSRIENGHISGSIADLNAIAKALECELVMVLIEKRAGK